MFNAEFDKTLQGILKIFIPRPKFDKFSLHPEDAGSLKQAISPVLWGPTRHALFFSSSFCRIPSRTFMKSSAERRTLSGLVFISSLVLFTEKLRHPPPNPSGPFLLFYLVIFFFLTTSSCLFILINSITSASLP